MLLATLAANCLVHADRALVLWMREAANAGGWYALRRPLQGATLALLVTTVWFMVPHVVRSGRLDLSDHLRPAMAGLGLLVVLLVLRLVSLHHTDFVLDARLAGLSLGRWLEALAVGLVMVPALRAKTGPVSRPFQKKPHV